MLDREVVERLEAQSVKFAAISAAGFASRIPVEPTELIELLRVYRMWMEAPVVEVQEIGDVDGTPTVIATGTRDELRKGASLVYKNVRLVRDGEPGEGES